MIRSISVFILMLAALSILTGWLLSKINWIGKAGIKLAYGEYAFLRVWWKGALLVFVVWIIMFLIQHLLRNRRPAWLAPLVVTILSLIGLYVTYDDFRNNLSHRFLGERFHLGGYLFWVGMILTALFHFKFANGSPSTSTPAKPH